MNIEPASDTSKLVFDLMGEKIIANGLRPVDVKKLDGISSMEDMGYFVTVNWYDFSNLLRELKKIGYSEADFGSDEAYNFISNIKEYENVLELFRTEEVDIEAVKFNSELYKIQKAGSAFLLYRRVGSLFDEMGTGKTVQSVYSYGLLKKKLGRVPKCLVLCPKNVKIEWRNAFKKFLGIDVQFVEDGMKRSILVAHYEQLIDRRSSNKKITKSKFLDNLLNFEYDVLVIDEAHFVKNLSAKRSRAFQALVKRKVTSIDKFMLGKVGEKEIYSRGQLPYVWFLTGTPMEKPKDIYTILRTSFGKMFIKPVTFINLFMNFEEVWFYGRRILKPTGVRNYASLMDLVSKVSLRRKRSEIVEIESITRENWQEFNSKQLSAYWKAVSTGKNPLAEVMKGIQFANHPALVDVNMSSPKHDYAVETIKATDKKVVVWTVFREAVKLLENRLKDEGIKAVSFRGGDDVEVVSKKFMEGDAQVCIATISKGAHGVNFMKVASTVIYLEKPYSYTLFTQSTDRVMRIDRDLSEPVMFLYLGIENVPTDHILNQIIEEKTDLNKLILEGLKIERKQDPRKINIRDKSTTKEKV